MRDKIRLNASFPLFTDEFMKKFLLDVKNTIDNEDILYEHSTNNTNIFVYKLDEAEVCISNMHFCLEFNPENINIRKFIDTLRCEYNKLKIIYEHLDTLYKFTIYTPYAYNDEIKNQLIELGIIFEENKSCRDNTMYFTVHSQVKFYN